MNNRELEEQYEAHRSQRLADALGISVDELALLEFTIEDNSSNDDMLYGHFVYFEEGSDPEVLKKYGWAIDGEGVDINPIVD